MPLLRFECVIDDSMQCNSQVRSGKMERWTTNECKEGDGMGMKEGEVPNQKILSVPPTTSET